MTRALGGFWQCVVATELFRVSFVNSSELDCAGMWILPSGSVHCSAMSLHYGSYVGELVTMSIVTMYPMDHGSMAL